MITHFVISTHTLNSSSSQKGEKAIEISASVFRSKIRVLMSPDSAIGSTKRPLGGHLYGFLQRRARVITMDLVGSPGAPSATHELVRRLLRLPHIIGTVTTDYGSRCISVGRLNKRNQEIKGKGIGGDNFAEQYGFLPFKADSSIFESNGFELGSTGLVISPLVPSGWDDRCSAVQRISRQLCSAGNTANC